MHIKFVYRGGWGFGKEERREKGRRVKGDWSNEL